MPLEDKRIQIYRTQDYSLVQTIVCGSEPLKIGFTPAQKIFAEGRRDRIIEVYEYKGDKYQQIQLINVTFYIYALVIGPEILIASGYQKIHIYRSDGTGYSLDQIIPTPG